jgi:hypothetical protein
LARRFGFGADSICEQVQTTAASNTFDGLTAGQIYNVELNAVGTAGTTDWSGPGELMIT